MKTHTPAPWHINRTFKTALEIWAAGTPKIAVVPDQNVSINEQEANALLIHAAPDLLQALEDLTDAYARIIFDNYGSDGLRQDRILHNSRTAIDKAKGS